jgi:hypothetical protein
MRSEEVSRWNSCIFIGGTSVSLAPDYKAIDTFVQIVL